MLSVEFKGPPHGEESVLDTRIEGFNTPWLHISVSVELHLPDSLDPLDFLSPFLA